MQKTRQVWRLEDGQGRGPFEGQGDRDETIPWAQWKEFLADTVGKSDAIARTRMTPLRLLLDMEELRGIYGREPVFGAPDRDCFERWFPEKWRQVYGERGFRPTIYEEVPDRAVLPGSSEAEVIFIPLGTKRVLDAHSLVPIT